MKASGSLRRNNFWNQRGSNSQNNYSSGSISIAKPSGRVTTDNAVLSEVIVQKDKGAEEIVMGDDAMKGVPKHIEGWDSGKQGCINVGFNAVNADTKKRKVGLDSVTATVLQLKSTIDDEVDSSVVRTDGYDRLGKFATRVAEDRPDGDVSRSEVSAIGDTPDLSAGRSLSARRIQ
ncbi:hypothetical protein LWI29_021738 [Acer saccharum]|uniref:Uncharacterized protein n=1 Tax=Acer saccharum TaxID=4024 RepID=A0AA39T6W7_ACESA|nr:hypothetical protein LWI29_021738 [Acer saccharum]